MSDEIDKMRIHTLTFSEEEFKELMMVSDLYGMDNERTKNSFPEFWKMMNRMSYVVSHGTEDGWSD